MKFKAFLAATMILSGLFFNVAVSQTVTADFSWTQDCADVAFENLSGSTGGINITGYSWDFGDGNNSALVNPVHTYAGVGNYDVQLTVFHDGAGGTETVTKTVSVWNPSANFIATSPCLGLPMEFTSTSSSPNSPIINWEWDFDNDGTYDATGQTVSYTYAVPGPHMVVLRITNELNCMATTNKNVVVKAPPEALFSANAVCFGEPTQFVNLSTTPNGTLAAFRWDFDDDGVFDSFVEEPTHTFPAAGFFPVTLEVDNNIGCTGSFTGTIEVLSLPEASYSVGPGCPLEPTAFTDESVAGSGAVVFWEWDFDDGSPLSNDQNPVHTYLNNGDYNVSLLVEDENGCQDDTTTLVVQQKPDAGFQVTETCFGQPTLFDDTSAYTAGFNVESWSWDFGDGNTSAEEDPQHTYGSEGLYDVELIVMNALMCSDTAYKTILVDTIPQAGFSFDAACEGLPTCFFDESIANADTIVAWEWDFGDGNSSTLSNPCHIFFTGGNYDVTLTVVNSDGCVSEPYTQTIFVSVAPAVNFTYNEICFGDTTFFINLTDTFGYEIGYLHWDFGDPASPDSVSSLFNPSHLFTSPGSYDVKLVVGNTFGCLDSIINTVTVDSLPEAFFTMPDTASVGVVFELTDLSIEHGSPIFTWFWEFGDGTSGTNITPITHTYYETGEFIVCLTVTDFNGCDHSYCDTITVVDKPVADFSYASDVTLETFFTDLSQPANTIVDWFWDFGDLTTTLDTISGTPDPMYQYPAEDWYTVYLKVTDKFGGVHDTTKVIYAGNAITASFTQFGQCVGDTTIFIDNSSSQIFTTFETFYWDFGDGTDTTYSVQSDTIIHFYQTLGNYTVKFAVSDTINGFFMTDTLSKIVSIFESPAAKIDTLGLDVCFGTTIQFNDATQAMLDPIEQWIWDFDTDLGDSAFIQNPEFLYADTGSYNVKMTVFTENGCSSIDSVYAHVNFSPEFGFVIQNNCVNSPTFFVPDYDSTAMTITKWFWDFGDELSSSNTSTLATPSHEYTRVDEYTVTMKMEAYSCAGETQQTMLVFPIPYSQFTFEENYGEVQGRTLFTNNSIYAETYLWDFGNGNTSNVAEPVEVYEFDSTYTVTLISYNEYLCSDTSRAEISVFFRGLYFPTAFSPNNPNEEITKFTPKGVNLKQYTVQVFDLRGNMLWESSALDHEGTPTESWDGYYDGRLMPQGMYIWKAAGKFTDGSVWQGQSFNGEPLKTTGVVTLVR